MDIDSIDITDSAFSLDVPTIVTGSGGDSPTDYTMFIYIGIASILLAVGMFIYKIYQNKKHEIVEDCQGGFCNMNEQHDNQYNQQI